MIPRHRWLAVIAAAVVAGTVAGYWADTGRDSPASRRDSPPTVTPLSVGDPLPPGLALTLTDGTVLPLARFHGRPLLINVWASWCAPCVEEMPELAAFSRQQEDNGTAVIGLALDTPEAVAAFLDRLPVPYPIAIASPGPADASVLLGNERGLLPYTVLIGPDGRVIRQKLGPFASGEIARWARFPADRAVSIPPRI